MPIHVPLKTKSYSSRPYVMINCAMSVDGKLALPSHKPLKLSSPEDFKRVHELRNYCDGVLVGINTILMDDPKLTVKTEFIPKPNQPIRIVLDTTGRTPEDALVLNGIAQTIILMGEKYKKSNKQFPNAEVFYCEQIDEDLLNLKDVLKTLKDKGIEILMVEGGETIIYNFLRSGLVDEIYIYMSNIVIGGTSSPTLAGGLGAGLAEDVIQLRLLSHESLGEGLLLKYLPIM
jgi:2,5-diamino-6-(ribosylamino)-4(3H)-pyrimidinone 5'-phosphate reductase